MAKISFPAERVGLAILQFVLFGKLTRLRACSVLLHTFIEILFDNFGANVYE